MKLIIAGTRDLFVSNEDMDRSVRCFKLVYGNVAIAEVVSGKAKGVDALGEAWARRNNLPVQPFPADWTKHGKAAGPIRNRVMAAYADGALVLWDGKSPGAKNMFDTMKKLGKPALCLTLADGELVKEST